MGFPVKQSSTAQPLPFFLVLSSDHITGATGLTPTVTLRKVGGSFASPAGTVTEIANGWYQVAGNATDSNTLGPLLLHATAGTADPWDDMFSVVAYDPQIATNLGLSGLPTANPGAANGIFIAGSNAATTFATMTVTGALLVSGTSTYTGLVTNTAGMASGITGNITGNLSGSVGSVTGAVGSVTGAVGSVTGSVGSVTGSVASVTGSVASVSGSVGSVVNIAAQSGDAFARLGSPSGGSVSADIAAIAVVTSSIASTQTTFTVSDLSPTTGQFAISGAGLSSTPGFYSSPMPMVVEMTSGTQKGRTNAVTGYTVVGGTKTLVFALPWPGSPATNDTGSILGYISQ